MRVPRSVVPLVLLAAALAAAPPVFANDDQVPLPPPLTYELGETEAIADEEARPCPPPLVTPSEAVEAVARWGAWTGITPETGTARLEIGGAVGGFFGCYYAVTSADGRYRARVNAYSGHPGTWEDTHATAAYRQQRPHAILAEDVRLEREKEAVLSRCTFLDPSRVEHKPTGKWVQVLGEDVVFLPNYGSCSFDDSGAVMRVSHGLTQPQVELVPRISVARSEELARKAVVNLTGARTVLDWRPFSAAAESFLAQWMVSQDVAGLQRLSRGVHLWYSSELISRQRLETMDETSSRGSSTFIKVDGVTGECFYVGGYSGQAGLYGLTVGGYTSLEFFQYPGRLAGGRPYVYAGYLDSYIWQAKDFKLTASEVEGTYKGVRFRAVAGERKLTLGDRVVPLRVAPKAFYERLYLPGEVIGAITGWQVTFDKATQSVDIRCPKP
jgi:hypothetical protein